MINKQQLLKMNNKQLNSRSSGFLLISYNEGGNGYNIYDCFPILMKVFLEKPSIIVVCTQDSATKRFQHAKPDALEHHYQHILGEYLKQQGYMVGKIDASEVTYGDSFSLATFSKAFYPISQKGTGIRTRVYIHVDYKNNYTGKRITFEKSPSSDAVLTKIQLNNRNIAIVNCDLGKKNTKLNRIVDRFKLVKLSETYNIFFCGNLNLTLSINNTLLLKIGESNNSKKTFYQKLYTSLVFFKTQLNSQQINSQQINSQQIILSAKIGDKVSTINYKVNEYTLKKSNNRMLSLTCNLDVLKPLPALIKPEEYINPLIAVDEQQNPIITTTEEEGKNNKNNKNNKKRFNWVTPAMTRGHETKQVQQKIITSSNNQLKEQIQRALLGKINNVKNKTHILRESQYPSHLVTNEYPNEVNL